MLGTAAAVGRQAGVDASTVVRFARASGYSGWTEMQQVLRSAYLAGLNASDTHRTHVPAGSPMAASLRQDLTSLRTLLESIVPDTVDSVVAALDGARSILVIASGSYSAPALVLAHLLGVMGLPARLEDRSGVHLASATAHLGADDVVVAVNLWRQTTDVVAATRVAADLGATVVAISDTRGGIAQHAEHVLLVPSESQSFFQSTTGATALVYGLVAELAALRDGTDNALERTQMAWDAIGALGSLGD